MVGQRIVDEEIRAQRLELISRRRVSTGARFVNRVGSGERPPALVASQRPVKKQLFRTNSTQLCRSKSGRCSTGEDGAPEVVGRLAQLEIERLALMDLLVAR